MADRERDGVTSTRPARTGRADLHMHTAVGDGLSSVSEMLAYAERETDLDVIAITDHDDIRAALDAREQAARGTGHVEVIPGTEITTRHGHVLALFVDHNFPMMQSLDQTLAAIHEAGGIAICPHPMSWLTTAISEAQLRRLHALDDAGRASGVYFDAIEVRNSSLAGQVAWERAKALNRTILHLPVVAGSDAHAAHLMNTAYTTFPGASASDLRVAIVGGTTRAHGRFWTMGETWSIAGESTYRAWFILPMFRLRRVLGKVDAPAIASSPAKPPVASAQPKEAAAHR